MRNQPIIVDTEIRSLALQLRLDVGLLFQEIKWALGEERINRVTPTYDQFRIWSRERDGLNCFWEFANLQIGTQLSPDEVHDIWNCIELTLVARTRRAFSFQDYLMIAIRSDQQCEYCRAGRNPRNRPYCASLEGRVRVRPQPSLSVPIPQSLARKPLSLG